MPKLSAKKEEKISEQIIDLLFSKSPELVFTSTIACELARDEEFIKRLLQSLESKGLVTSVDKNPQGIQYHLRKRWRISSKAFKALKDLQTV